MVMRAIVGPECTIVLLRAVKAFFWTIVRSRSPFETVLDRRDPKSASNSTLTISAKLTSLSLLTVAAAI